MIEIDHGKVSYVGNHTQYEEESSFYKKFLENLAKKDDEEDDEDTVPKEIPPTSISEKVTFKTR